MIHTDDSYSVIQTVLPLYESLDIIRKVPIYFSGKEIALKQQIEKFDEMIMEAKYQLDVLSNEEFEPGMKPRIRSPSKDSSISSSSR